MATDSNTSGEKAAATRKRNEARDSAAATRSNARRTTTSAKTTASRTSSATKANARRTANSAGTTAGAAATATTAETRLRVTQVQQIAERAVLVPVGAGLLARDNFVTTVKGLATKYGTRASVERELKRYERRGASARNRFERQVRRTRTKFERELRQRRNRVERTVKENRRRVERDLTSVRKDLGKQSEVVTARVEKFVSEAQGRLTAPLS
ncbi:MAG TPA: hypothetical protein VE571_11175 [Solirubrobacteraceae bacterium]|nr:hypothetical protein [Solirubrobacteraceae bacterium]